MMNLKISASIVTYNGYDEAAKAAKSVLENTIGAPLELFIIDNASPDGTGERLAQTNFGENAKVISLPQNVGFGSGHNKVLPLITSEFHAVINPDIVLCEDTLTLMCEWMLKNPDVVITTPRLVFPGGDEQNTAKRTPSFMGLLSRQLPLKVFKNIERHYLMLDEDLSAPCDIEFCSGCFFVIRTDAFKEIGGFDEKYFMYVEDADITRKALRCGRAVFLPSTYVQHAWHRDANKKLKNFLMQIKSMLRYWLKWGFKFI